MKKDTFAFGFLKSRNKEAERESKNPVSFVPHNAEDGAIVIQRSRNGVQPLGSGFFSGDALSIETEFATDREMILKYREIAMHPEADAAIQDIVTEAIVTDEDGPAVDIILEGLETVEGFDEKVKETIRDEFHSILRLLNFNEDGPEIFHRWYVDSRLFYHVIPYENPRMGIYQLRMINAIHIQKVVEIEKEPKYFQGQYGSLNLVSEKKEYFVYSNNEVVPEGKGVQIAPEAICYVHSGLYDRERRKVVGYLHKAIKPVNQLRMLEDAVVIYRLARAPERRVFYIDVGNLPKQRAEQFLEAQMSRYRNKQIYDSATGNIKDSPNHLSMMEDFWFPRREGGRASEVTTLAGGQNLGEIEDVLYFQRKMYKALNVPITRMESENSFNLGRASEITRDELKFNKFVNRLRKRFSHLFTNLLKTQLVMKGVLTEQDWDKACEYIAFDFMKDSFFSELKEAEIMRERLGLVRDLDEFVGKYYSIGYIRRNVLMQSEDEIKAMDKEIQQERQSGEIEPEDEGDDFNNDTF
jgi:hypothetical protein